MEASSHLPSPGFFGLLRNLRSAKRTGPDFEELFVQLGCNHCFENGGVIRRWYSSARFRRSVPKT